MVSQDFKAFTHKVSTALTDNNVHVDVYTLLGIADALFVEPVAETPHDALVRQALEDPGHLLTDYAGNQDNTTVLEFLQDNKKINAIKRLRLIAGSGLKESKEAIEDERVTAKVTELQVEALRAKLTSNPWDQAFERDEPPF
jgi:ribosomal protein L7/L12